MADAAPEQPKHDDATVSVETAVHAGRVIAGLRCSKLIGSPITLNGVALDVPDDAVAPLDDAPEMDIAAHDVPTFEIARRVAFLIAVAQDEMRQTADALGLLAKPKSAEPSPPPIVEPVAPAPEVGRFISVEKRGGATVVDGWINVVGNGEGSTAWYIEIPETKYRAWRWSHDAAVMHAKEIARRYREPPTFPTAEDKQP